MSCKDLRKKFVLNKSSCNNLCDDSNGHPSKCNFNCDMECAHAGSSGGGGSSGNYQMVYDNCYSQNCTSSVGCNNLAQVLDCCNSNCNKNPVCMDVCSSNNANKGRPVGPVDRSKAYGYFMDCAASVSGDDNEHDKAIDCCASKCGNDAGCKSDCANFAIGYYKPRNSLNMPFPVYGFMYPRSLNVLYIALGIAALIGLIAFIISRRKNISSKLGFRFY